MSRMQMGGEPIPVKPSNNAFTVFAAAGFIVVLLGLIALFLRAKVLLDPNSSLFSS